MRGDKQLTLFLEERREGEPETRMYVSLTVYRIPIELLEEFGRKVVKHYSGGVSDAILHLMKKAIQENTTES